MTEAEIRNLPDERIIKIATTRANTSFAARIGRAFIEIPLDFDATGKKTNQRRGTAIYKCIAGCQGDRYYYVFQGVY